MCLQTVAVIIPCYLSAGAASFSIAGRTDEQGDRIRRERVALRCRICAALGPACRKPVCRKAEQEARPDDQRDAMSKVPVRASPEFRLRSSAFHTAHETDGPVTSQPIR